MADLVQLDNLFACEFKVRHPEASWFGVVPMVYTQKTLKASFLHGAGSAGYLADSIHFTVNLHVFCNPPKKQNFKFTTKINNKTHMDPEIACFRKGNFVFLLQKICQKTGATHKDPLILEGFSGCQP